MMRPRVCHCAIPLPPFGDWRLFVLPRREDGSAVVLFRLPGGGLSLHRLLRIESQAVTELLFERSGRVSAAELSAGLDHVDDFLILHY